MQKNLYHEDIDIYKLEHMNCIECNKGTFELVLFYAAWCPHSKTLLGLPYDMTLWPSHNQVNFGAWSKLKTKMHDHKNLTIYEVDVDKSGTYGYNINSYPTIILFKGNRQFIFDDPDRSVAKLETFIHEIMLLN